MSVRSRVSQMDLESASWQMVTLCIDPKRVYKQTTYHKQTKNQWARDDPAFTVRNRVELSMKR